ncbi:MAG: M13 family metallopeptidase, partial [Bacteroidia bacterium]
RLEKLDWMGPATKAEALKKLDGYTIKVGYPDNPRDYSLVVIRDDDLVGNVLRAAAADWGFYCQRVKGPVDRSDWWMTPQTNDAYNGSLRDIVFPAGILLPPMFDPNADAAYNFGAAGGVIGHELTHGFDDQGSQYDEKGNLNNWWTDEDKKKFLEKTKRIVTQFSNYKVLDSLHINGDATQGENIADLGGVVMGYEAFKKTAQGQGNDSIGGFTPDQRYFLGYGYAWMVNRRPESLARQVMSDVHSPSQYRVNGPVSNIPEFYKAFDVKPGDAMYREDSVRVVIW